MYAVWSRITRAYEDERGFTLPELLVTIAILGILIAIAIIIWLGILEQRRVDAAARQFAADLRLAHSSATNQLAEWRITYNRGTPNYELRKVGKSDVTSRSLPEGTKVLSASNMPSANNTATVELNPDGSGTAFYGCSTTIRISSTDGNPYHDIGFVCATSKVEIDP